MRFLKLTAVLDATLTIHTTNRATAVNLWDQSRSGKKPPSRFLLDENYSSLSWMRVLPTETLKVARKQFKTISGQPPLSGHPTT